MSMPMCCLPAFIGPWLSRLPQRRIEQPLLVVLARVFPLDHRRPIAPRALGIREELAAGHVADPQPAIESRLKAPYLVGIPGVVPLDHLGAVVARALRVGEDL